MYCPSCGKEIRDDESFCSRCGAQVGGDNDAEPVAICVAQIRGLDKLWDNKVSYFISLLLQVIGVYLIGKTMFNITYTLFLTNTVKYSLFEGKESVGGLFTFGYIVGIAAMLIPLLLRIKWSKINFAVGICMPILSAIWFVYVMASAGKELTSGAYTELLKTADISISLTGNAICFLVVSVVQILVTYKACNDILLTQENKERQLERQNMERANTGDSDVEMIKCPKCGRPQKKGGAICNSCYSPLFKL